MPGILKVFTAIKYFPKNYKGIVILGDFITKLKVHGIGIIALGIQTKIELHDVLYVPDIAYTLYSIIKHGCQHDYLFVIKNEVTILGFPTFTLLFKTNK